VTEHNASIEAAKPAAPQPGPTRPGWWFQLAALSAALFVVTVLALIATVFADPRAPVNQWLNANAGWLMLVEVVAIVVFGVGAMWRDQASRVKPQPTPGADASGS
jgi:hypothetical protein